MKKFQIVNQNHAKKDANFATFLIPCFFDPERLLFYLERHERLFMGLFDVKKKKEMTLKG